MDKLMPTQEQIEELWKWCGLPYGGYGSLHRWRARSLPPIDLNNLFRHAVPKAVEKIQALFHVGEARAYELLFQWWCEKLIETMEHPNSVMTVTHPALALFLVLQRIKEAKE